MVRPNMDEVVTLLEQAVGKVFPAAQLLVVDGGEEVLAHAAGAADLETRFDLASLTKALCTATLTMRFIERGILSFDTEARPGVSVYHLLCHASGLPAWKLLEPPGAADVRRAIVERVRSEPLEATPGIRSVYSDLGFILLGDLLETVGGARLDRLFTDEIAAPLELGLTFGPVPSAAPTESGLVGIVHDENARAMEGVAGHAGLFGTARAVSRLVASLVWARLGEARPGHAVPSVVSGAVVHAFWSPSGIPQSTWCLGWDRPAAEGSSAGRYWPRSGVGHLGFTGCSVWVDPARASWVVLLTNRVCPTRENNAIKAFRPALHDAIWQALEGERTE